MWLPCILLCIFSTVRAGDDLGQLIDEVFGTPNNQENSAKSAQPSSPSDCTCVPYYLCQNNSIITDGVGLIDIRVKDGPCENYLDVCCGEQPLPPLDKITPPPATRTGCGRRNEEGVGFRITGDVDGEAQFGEFPWVVVVLKEEVMNDQRLNVFQCGGALIHPEVNIQTGKILK